MLGTVRSGGDLGRRSELSFVEWIDIESRPLPESVKELTGGKGADLILDVVGGLLFQPCLESLAQRGRQIAIASAGKPQVTFNLVDFYHKEARLIGVDTLKLSFSESAEILKALLPGFKAGVFSLLFVTPGWDDKRCLRRQPGPGDIRLAAGCSCASPS